MNPQQGGTYPKDKNEVDKFVIGIIKSLHDEKIRPQLMKQLTNEQVPVHVRIGNVVSQVMTALLSKVRQQSGRKPHRELLLKSIKMVVMEVTKMAEMAGVKVTPDDQRNAAGIAGQMIESGQQKGPQQPTEQPTEQPQGLIGGANG